MPPDALNLALFIIEEAIKLEPGIAAAISGLFAKADPTAADWCALRASVAGKSYDDYVNPPAPAPVPATVIPALAPANLVTLPSDVIAPQLPPPSANTVGWVPGPTQYTPPIPADPPPAVPAEKPFAATNGIDPNAPWTWP
jgi:hypothetical protein